MATADIDSRLTLPNRDVPGYLRATLDRFFDLLSAWRPQRRTRCALQARSDSVPEDIRLMRAKIDLELLRLYWLQAGHLPKRDLRVPKKQEVTMLTDSTAADTSIVLKQVDPYGISLTPFPRLPPGPRRGTRAAAR